MKEIQDKIYDAYYFKMGNEFGEKVRERIHWIVNNTKGKDILEVGCSQGITSILLGREGKNVLGIDVSESVIQEALHNLEKEENETKQLVKFEQANFFLKDFEKQFDVVILGEVLEHVLDINTFFNKAIQVTKDNGQIIVTTPFGINNFIDHKRTFYIKDFFELQHSDVKIEDIKFFGKWIGVIYKKCKGSVLRPDLQLLNDFEKILFNNEKDLTNKNALLKKRLDKLNKQIKEIKEENKDEESYKEKYIQIKTEKVHLQKELLKEYDKQEKLLEKNKVLSDKLERLEVHYNNLRNSKLGKLTMKYWEFRKRRR